MIEAHGDHRDPRQARIDRAVAAARASRTAGQTDAEHALSVALDRLIADLASAPDHGAEQPDEEPPQVHTAPRRGPVHR